MGLNTARVFRLVASQPRRDTLPILPIREARMSRFWSKLVSELSPYVPGEQPQLDELVKLNTNENPYGPAPGVLAAIAAETGDCLRLYPDPHGTKLANALASRFGLQRSQVFLGNGSDEVLGHTFLALLKQELPLLFADVTYSFYPVYAQLYGIKSELVPVSRDYGIVVDDYLARPSGAIIVANPNAPTGRFLPVSEVERLLRGKPDCPVVVDEAYVDFGGESAARLIEQYPNLLVIQTFSKSRSLAGLRVGYALGHPELIEALERIKNCFNSYPLDRLALAGAQASVEDETYFQDCCARVSRSRDELTRRLAALGFEVLPSLTNFVFARHPARDAGELAAQLRQRAIIVRHFRSPRIEQFLRISVGTDAQCERLVGVLAALVPKS